ncbi:CRISPR-associated endonuclease Cas2 [Carnobacterium gallinarum]|uniref:CRISPR-associated endonuclease Cas2 n=1 Tax=Carnobacterium gallinarum TaxID=2749 RepID=UPI00054EE621|nr:CRISPR-associated endonuclease Cas2 [Carnobacterium gallinarum]
MSMNRFMRILVMFDLPVGSKRERREAVRFRNYLLNEGYVMMQFSVYYRICSGYDMVKKYEHKLERHLPNQGSVRMVCMTEKQFSSMKLLVGDDLENEKKVNSSSLSIF